MSVLAIGATGFIGPRLIRRLVGRGEAVVGMDLSPGAASVTDVALRAPLIRGDVTQFEDVMRAVLEVKPDRLINLAYGLGAGEGNPHQVMRLDVLGMDNCFEDYLVDHCRLGDEFWIEYPGLHTRVLGVINEVRRQEGLPLVAGDSGASKMVCENARRFYGLIN